MKNSYYKSLFRNIIRMPSFIVPLFILLLLFLSSFIVFIIYNNSLGTNINNSFITPNIEYIFGTNEYGQNFFVVVFIGIFNTLILSTIASFINLLLGGIFGIIWGNSSKMDCIMIVIKNIIDNIPTIFFYIIIITSLGSGFLSLLLIILLLNWINTACLIRNNLLIIRNKDFNQMSKLLKTSHYKIAINNYLPSLLPIIFNNFAISFPKMISLEITLAYFGINLTNQKISLGNVLYNSISNNYYFSLPYLFIIPFIFLLIINLCYFYIGKAIATTTERKEKELYD